MGKVRPYLIVPVDLTGWHHWACSYDTSGSEMYLDGVSVESDTGDHSNAETGTTFDLYNRYSHSGKWDGDVDEFAYFKRVLNSTEVNDIKDNGLSPITPPAQAIVNIVKK